MKRYIISIDLKSTDSAVKLTECFDNFMQARIIPHKLRYSLKELKVVEVDRED